MSRECNYYLGFSVFSGIGPVSFQVLLEKFGTAKDAWNASDSDLRELLKNKLTEKFVAFRKTYALEAYAEKMQEAEIDYLISSEDAYPQLLKNIKNPPFVLFVKGNREIFKDPKRTYVGIVGTRKITSYGNEVTRMITADLVNAGCVIVSGLALGVDAVAHKTTVENRGKTVAVLGCGVDLCYPSANQAIYNSILTSGGVIVSEYPPGQQPTIGSFPSRNRIIAGLSNAVVVTEGAEDSGALITASNAILQQRPVFAVPGPITSSLSKGPLKLLQQGARIVTSADDILSEFGVKRDKKNNGAKREIKGDTKEEQEVINLLQGEGLLFDEIVGKTKVPAAVLSMTLSLMEVKGVIRKTDGRFELTPIKSG